MKSIFGGNSPFATYGVTLQFRDRLVGGTPKNQKQILDWLKARPKFDADLDFLDKLMEISEEMGLPIPETRDADWLDQITGELVKRNYTQGFKMDADGCYIEGRQAKAMIKEAANILWPKRTWGKSNKGTRGFWAERVFVEPYKIPLGTSAPAVDQFVGHIKGPQGPQSTLSLYEYVEQPAIDFTVEVLDDCIEQEDWIKIWQLAERNGLGAKRSQSFGQFVVTRWERLA